MLAARSNKFGAKKSFMWVERVKWPPIRPLPGAQFQWPGSNQGLLRFVLTLLGINHQTAPIDVRERVNFLPDQVGEALASLSALPGCAGVALLSTCNRTELYLDADLDSEDLVRWLADWHHYDSDMVRRSHYFYRGDEAAAHLLRVAAGLDSMVLGEPQILGQLKEAYARAEQEGMVNSTLHQAFQYAFAVAKRIRTDTAIGENPVSVAYAAVSLSKQIFATLDDKTALLVGAGETIALVARHLREQGVGKMIIANRTMDRARDLANELDAEAILLADIHDCLPRADIVVTSTASQLPLLGKGAVESALRKRKHRLMFLIDLAVPRDIEPEVGDLEDAYLFSIDDLKTVVEENRRQRELAAREAERIVETSVRRWSEEVISRDNVDLIRMYRTRAEKTMAAELARARSQLAAGQSPEDVLERLANSLTKKLIHHPTSELNRIVRSGDAGLTATAKRLLGLHNSQDGSTRDESAE